MQTISFDLASKQPNWSMIFTCINHSQIIFVVVLFSTLKDTQYLQAYELSNSIIIYLSKLDSKFKCISFQTEKGGKPFPRLPSTPLQRYCPPPFCAQAFLTWTRWVFPQANWATILEEEEHEVSNWKRKTAGRVRFSSSSFLHEASLLAWVQIRTEGLIMLSETVFF